MKTLQKDLTTGNPGKIIFNFTLPIFIGNVFQQFYSMADTIIVGKFVGTKALAAVGSTGTIMLDRKSTRLNSSHDRQSRMPSSA